MTPSSPTILITEPPIGWTLLRVSVAVLDSSPENHRQEESNNLTASGGKQVDDLLDGCRRGGRRFQFNRQALVHAAADAGILRGTESSHDSPLEGDEFEPSVPRSRSGDFRSPKVERV